MVTPKIRIAIVTNIAWNLYNFRRGLAAALKECGYQPVLMAAPDSYVQKLEEEGWEFVPLHHLKRTGQNPIDDAKLFFEFVQQYKANDIQFALHYHAKPLVYGSMAASYLNIPFVATIAGLAGPFSGNRKMAALIVEHLYRFSLKKAVKVIFQNKHDLNFMLEKRIVEKKNTDMVGGSGVNTKTFDASVFPPPSNEKLVFLMLSRLSWEKGVGYYVEAAAAIRKKYPNTEFRLAGPFDNDGLAISQEKINEWVDSGTIKYLGVSDYVQEELSQAHVIVHPSFYMEGVPRALLEAASMSKPIITTDHTGCNEIVDDQVNGFLIPIKNAAALIDACERFIALPEQKRKAMGAASREKVLASFDERKVFSTYVKYATAHLPVPAKSLI